MNNKDLIRQYVDTGSRIPEYQMKQLPNNLLRTYIRKRILRASRTHESIEPYELNGFTPEEFNQHINNKKDFKLYDSLHHLPDNLLQTYLRHRVKSSEPGYRHRLDDEEFKYVNHYPDILKDYIDHVKRLSEEEFKKLDKNFLPYYFKQRANDLTGDYSDIHDYEFDSMDSNMAKILLDKRYNLAMNDETEDELNDTEIMRLDTNQQKQYILHVLTKNNVDIDYKTRQDIINHFPDGVTDTFLNWVISRGQELEDDEIKSLNNNLRLKYVKTQLKKGNNLPDYLMSWYENRQRPN